MKGVLAWVKANLVVVICTAVIIIVLPVSWFFSSGWNESIRASREKTVKADYDKVRSFKVKYSWPAIDPSTAAVEVDAEPNAALTDFFKTQNARVKTEAEGVVKLAEEHNRRGHKVLVEGLLPSGTGPEGQSKAYQMAKMVVGNQGVPWVYKELFESMGGGDPRASNEVYEALRDTEVQNLQAIRGAQGNRPLTPEEQAKVTKALLEKRTSEYQKRAKEISFYANPDVLGAQIPRVMPKEPPSIREVFQWQSDFWLTADILGAVRLANTDERGQALPVERAVVKKIERIVIRPSAFSAPRAGEGQPEEQPTGETAAPPAPDAQVVPDYSRSISGRWSGQGNGVYDVRKAEVTLIVSAKNIGVMFDAFGRSNFITITDCDLYDVDLWSELERGYYFGGESVVRAKIEVEVVWLRSWTTAFMPAEVKQRLGIPEPAPAAAPEQPK